MTQQKKKPVRAKEKDIALRVSMRAGAPLVDVESIISIYNDELVKEVRKLHTVRVCNMDKSEWFEFFFKIKPLKKVNMIFVNEASSNYALFSSGDSSRSLKVSAKVARG